MPTVSIIIPLYNSDKYISRAIDSILAQTFQDFELIVVDDGSTDVSSDLVSKYQDQDPRVKLVHQMNMGPGSARNRGIKESTALYLAFLDADDEWLPCFLEKYLKALIANPECDYVVGPRFEGSRRFDQSEIWRKAGVIEGLWSLPSDISHDELHVFLTLLHYTCAMLCKRVVVEKYCGFYSKHCCRYGEDRYLQLQLLFNHQLYQIVEPLVWYHTETGGLSSLGGGVRPVNPALTDPEPIRESCPPAFRSVLEDYLASHALAYAVEYAQAGQLSTSRDLILRFPAMKKNKRKFLTLLLLMVFSTLRTLGTFGKRSE